MIRLELRELVCHQRCRRFFIEHKSIGPSPIAMVSHLPAVSKLYKCVLILIAAAVGTLTITPSNSAAIVGHNVSFKCRTDSGSGRLAWLMKGLD